MALNVLRNKRFGPGGSARRLHQLRFQVQTWAAYGADPGSTGVVKAMLVPGMVCRYRAILKRANDNVALVEDVRPCRLTAARHLN